MSTQSSSTPSVPPTFGRIGYDAYGEHSSSHGPWTTFDGRTMPKWEEYSAAGPGSGGAFTQERWEKAAEAIIAAYERSKANGRMRVGEFYVEVNTSEAEAAMSRLESRSEALVANLEKVEPLLAKLEQSAVGPRVDTINISEGQIDPFLMGISEIASATRDLAEASKAVPVDAEVIADLIEDTAKALHARVGALASPPTGPSANA
ncbi:MAG TPA: hypothetical protein VEZ71_19375 [Archangium sp.]|nr:hypothetical protein [Archangium sp.]